MASIEHETNGQSDTPPYEKRELDLVKIFNTYTYRMTDEYYTDLLKTVFDTDRRAKDQQKNNQLVNQLRKKLLMDPSAYVESLGRADVLDLIYPPDYSKTALRLVLGATTLMPYRSLSYAHSVIAIARTIPVEQIQIVHANHVGNKVNRVDLSDSGEQARIYAGRIREHVVQNFPDLEGRILHATDTPMDTDQYADLVQLALHQDEENATRLGAKATKNGGDAVRYGAAHYAFQDTDLLELEPLAAGSPKQIYADRIISVGGLQEKAFYRLRMGMQAIQTPVIYTGQIFTKHVTPPYYTARDGEPALNDDVKLDMLDAIGDSAAKRDIEHFLRSSKEGEEQ
jgi:hypothetical protein